MARTASDLARGQRVRAIREARGEGGAAFAAALQALCPDRVYDAAVISKIEGGGRRITFEEADAIARLDPEKHGREWLAWGPTQKVARNGELMPRETRRLPNDTPTKRKKSG
jgi:hypothetical protein